MTNGLLAVVGRVRSGGRGALEECDLEGGRGGGRECLVSQVGGDGLKGLLVIGKGNICFCAYKRGRPEHCDREFVSGLNKRHSPPGILLRLRQEGQSHTRHVHTHTRMHTTKHPILLP